MYRIIVIFFISILFLHSCHSKSDDEYFYKIDQEFTEVRGNQRKIFALYQRELNKYRKSNDLKYLISSKFGELYLYPDEKSKRISKIYELLRINDGEYQYITISCNFFMALQLEDTSPKLAL